MIRHIPQFILRKYQERKLEGTFTGFALLFDVADFTPIGTAFQKHGKEGAEELSAFLDMVFGTPIRIVESRGGFVSLFAGDAFCAIFPDTGPAVLDAVLLIRDHFTARKTFQCRCGEFPLRIRQTVSFGEIAWQIYENALQNEYVFHGNALKDLAELSLLKEDIVFSGYAARHIGMESFTSRGEDAYLPMDGITAQDHHPTGKARQTPLAFDHPALPRFINPKYRDDVPQPEIRSAAFCFANLEAIPHGERNSAVGTLQDLADKYGGFVNKYDATDKGLTALILFGIPRSEGKTLRRICDFSLEAVGLLPLLKLGISCGAVVATYAGIAGSREYTALGAPVNLAARLMAKAKPAEVLADSYLWQELHAAYEFNYMGSLTLKGIDQPIGYFSLDRPAQNRQPSVTPFVGRETETGMIRGIVESCLAERANSIVYVHGDAGIGKSRLVAEALAPYGPNASDPANICYKYTLSCDMVLQKPLEAIKQIIRAHFYYNPLLPKEAGIAMFRSLWGMIEAYDPETRRVESILASLLDYEWEASVWSVLPPSERPQQLKNAFIHFMRKLCAQRPVIIHLDDAQWLDTDSHACLQALSEAEIKPLLIICPCRYLESGSRVDLGLAKHARHDLELDSISAQCCGELCKSITRLATVPDATLELIYSRSMGNPLFIEQLASYLLETGSLDHKGEIVKELGYLSTFSINDIISSRIDRLTGKVRECLFGASVLGMEFNVKVLSEMLKSDLTQELESGANKRIWKDLDELRYIFSHILIKDVVYQRMMNDKLQKLHLLAAEAMELIYNDDLDENAEEIALHYEKAGIENKAADYYDRAGCWFKAKYEFHISNSYLNKALIIRENIQDTEHPDVARTLNNLAILYYNHGIYVEAELLFLRVLVIRKKVLEPEHSDTAMTLNCLAMLYHNQRLFDRAEPLYIKAHQIWEKLLGIEHNFTAASLNNLAGLYLDEGKFSEAKVLLFKANQIWNRVLGPDHPNTIMSLINLAVLYGNQGKYLEAEQLCADILNDSALLNKMEIPEIAKSLNNLAIVYINQHKFSQAEILLLKSIKILNNTLGCSHPWTQAAINGVIDLYKGTGQIEKAAEYQAMLAKDRSD
jgi:class 3 adenylate cyclase/Flp pilus assembly protein TadD